MASLKPTRKASTELDTLQPGHWRRNASNFVIYLMLILGSIMFILPLFWALSSSFKSDYQVMQYPRSGYLTPSAGRTTPRHSPTSPSGVLRSTR